MRVGYGGCFWVTLGALLGGGGWGQSSLSRAAVVFLPHTGKSVQQADNLQLGQEEEDEEEDSAEDSEEWSKTPEASSVFCS